MAQITQGVIAAITTREFDSNSEFKPLIQVIDIRLISTNNVNLIRYRLLVSDGVHSQQAMLGPVHNELVTTGLLQIGSIVKLIEFVCTEFQERVIIIIANIELVHDKCDIIGNPQRISRTGANNAAATKAPLMPTQTMNQPAAGNFVGSNSGPRPNTVGGNNYGGSPVTTSGPMPNLGGNFYGGSSVTNPGSRPNVGGSPYGGKPMMNSAPNANLVGNSYGVSAVPTFQRTEYASGVAHASYINQPPPSSHNQQPALVHNQRPTMYANRGPESGIKIMPIASLTPYQGRWTIKARVMAKTDLRAYTNAKGNGQVFSFNLLDSEGEEIRVTCFDDVAGRFYDVIKQGGVYTISKGSLKPANTKFNHLCNEYEIFLDTASTVEPCIEDDKTIPELQWHFHHISDVKGLSGDRICVVTSVDQMRSVTRKDQSTTLVKYLKGTLDFLCRDKISSVVSMLKGTLERRKLSNQVDKGTAGESSFAYQTQEQGVNVYENQGMYQDGSTMGVGENGVLRAIEESLSEGIIGPVNPNQTITISEEPSQRESSAAPQVFSNCFDVFDDTCVSVQAPCVSESFMNNQIGDGKSPEDSHRSNGTQKQKGALVRYGSVTSMGSVDRGDPTKKRRVELSRKMAEAQEISTTPVIPSDMQSILKRCDILEKEVRSLKFNLAFMNRKDSEQTKLIEELQKENDELGGDKERLLEEIESITAVITRRM